MPSSSHRSRMVLVAGIWAALLWWAVRWYGLSSTVRYDVGRWIEHLEQGDLSALNGYGRFAYLAGALPEFRTLVHYRLRPAPAWVRFALRALYPPARTLTLEADRIGPGLFIQHGTATVVSAESIGRDCWINQQVTVGFGARGRPTIGNGVRIGAGAVVIGPITLHDGVTVGANATVIDDVPAGVTMVAPLAVPVQKSPRRTVRD